ncbi:MAG: type I glutamate--ammonia ligase [Chloroflexi bacterium]|nr:type I glutamate--ammonia ligase [Chloroflexota bacterium]
MITDKSAVAAVTVDKEAVEQTLALARERGIKIVDLKFIDLPGLWQHFSIPATALAADLFTDGIGFDGSSIRGFQKIHESDMLLFPDPATAFIDPVLTVPTMSVVCDVVDPMTRTRYSRDPRFVARKAEEHLIETGVATTSYWGPELEFYMFNSIRFDQGPNYGYYYIDSDEGIWNSGRDTVPNLGYRPRFKEGYFPVPPTDKLQDVRSEIILKLIEAGIDVEVHHHEVGTAGQAEIDMRFRTLRRMADQVLMYKYIVRNICNQHGLVANFMPKPLFQDNGSGMHVHQSLWKDGQNLFYDPHGYALISEMARHYIGGLLKHAPSILAFAAPTTNSYRRLVPGYEAPVNLAYSMRNRSACVRIPMYSSSANAKRLEFRTPDPSCNPYLAFSALLMAGLDGVLNGIEPPAPIDEDLYELPPEEAAKIKSTPGSLEEVLNALAEDHEYLLRGDVFTEDVIRTWIEYKVEREVDPVRLRPHPWEFHLYSDI